MKRFFLLSLFFISLDITSGQSDKALLFPLNYTRIAQLEDSIRTQHLCLFYLKNGLKVTAAVGVVALVFALRRWAQEEQGASPEQIHDVLRQVKGHTGQLKIIEGTLQNVSEKVSQMHTPHKVLEEKQLLIEALKKRIIELRKHEADLIAANQSEGNSVVNFLYALPYELKSWGSWFMQNFVGRSIIGAGEALILLSITQGMAPYVFKYLDKVFYTFRYQWFVTTKTDLKQCFEELSRVSQELSSVTLTQEERAHCLERFIWTYNLVTKELEKVIAFKHVQNKMLASSSPVHTHYMEKLTNYYCQLIDGFREAFVVSLQDEAQHAKIAQKVAEYRDKLIFEDAGYKQNEEYVLGLYTHGIVQNNRELPQAYGKVEA